MLQYANGMMTTIQLKYQYNWMAVMNHIIKKLVNETQALLSPSSLIYGITVTEHMTLPGIY